MTQISSSEIDKAFAAGENQQQELATTDGKAELANLIAKPINSLVPIDPDTGKLMPTDFAGVHLVAKYMADNQLLPEAYWGNDRNPRTKAQVIGCAMAAIFQGRLHRMDPFAAVRWHVPIRNSLALWGDAVPGVVRSKLRDLGEKIKETQEWKGEGDTRECTVTIVHMDADGDKTEMSRTFSMALAKKGSLTGKGPWQSSPDRMLMHRARTFAYRDLFPDIMMGLAVAEEAADIVTETTGRERKGLDARLAEAKNDNTTTGMTPASP